MNLRCSSRDYKTSQIVLSSYGGHSRFGVARYGLYLSSFKIKYVDGGMITGIKMYAEGMPIISNIRMEYGRSINFESYPVTI